MGKITPCHKDAPRKIPAKSAGLAANLKKYILSFRGIGKPEKVTSTLGTLLYEDIEPSLGVTFIDATFVPTDNGSGFGVEQVDKAPGRIIFVSVPKSITCTPDDGIVKEVISFFETSYAGASDTLQMILSGCALSIFGYLLPQKLLVIKDDGGSGKSETFKLISRALGPCTVKEMPSNMPLKLHPTKVVHC